MCDGLMYNADDSDTNLRFIPIISNSTSQNIRTRSFLSSQVSSYPHTPSNRARNSTRPHTIPRRIPRPCNGQQNSLPPPNQLEAISHTIKEIQILTSSTPPLLLPHHIIIPAVRISMQSKHILTAPIFICFVEIHALKHRSACDSWIGDWETGFVGCRNFGIGLLVGEVVGAGEVSGSEACAVDSGVECCEEEGGGVGWVWG